MLPVALPKLKRDPKNWLNFKNTLEALIHENRQISPNIYYLKSAIFTWVKIYVHGCPTTKSLKH